MSIHVIPQEIPNRKFPIPPPFLYHPELYPEMAKANPGPSNLEIPRPKSKKVRKPAKLLAKVVDPEKIERVEIKTMTPELLKYHAKNIFDSPDIESINNF